MAHPIVTTSTSTSNDLPAPAQPTAGPSQDPQHYQPYPPPSFAPYIHPTNSSDDPFTFMAIQ
jgi:hypothetical protein